ASRGAELIANGSIRVCLRSRERLSLGCIVVIVRLSDRAGSAARTWRPAASGKGPDNRYIALNTPVGTPSAPTLLKFLLLPNEITCRLLTAARPAPLREMVLS